MNLKARYLFLLHTIRELVSNMDQLHVAKIREKIEAMVDEIVILDGIISKEDAEWDITGNLEVSLSNYYKKDYIDKKIKEVTDNIIDNGAKIENVKKLLEEKVDKEDGKSLILDTEIARLAELHNYDDTTIKESIKSLSTNKVDKEEGKSLLSDTEITRLLTLKNYDDSYLKEKVNDMILNKVDKIDGKSLLDDTEIARLLTLENYDDTEVKETLNNLSAKKANSSDVYTKTQVDTKLETKANSSDVYTKEEIDTSLGKKANSDDVYTKTELGESLALKANSSDVYTKEESDAKYQPLVSYISQAEYDALTDTQKASGTYFITSEY